MKKVIKTAEELRRDELVMEVRGHKDTMESIVRKLKRRQQAMNLLPESSREYEEYNALVNQGKHDLVSAMRSYESAREILGEYCRNYKLAGNTFIPVIELLELFAEK